MNLEDILNKDNDPSDFWNKLAQAAADDWHLSQCVVLQVEAKSIRLHGTSAGSNLKSAPLAIRKAIMGNPHEAQLIELEGEYWLIQPIKITAAGGPGLTLVAARTSALNETEQAHLGHFVEVAAAAFSAQRKAETSENSLNEISQVVDLGLMIGESVHGADRDQSWWTGSQ